MKDHEKVKLEFTCDWIKKAENDFAIAHHLNNSGEIYAFGTTFHAQQAVEKYLKAFLVWHQIEFRKTHDIQELLTLTSQVDPELLVIIHEAAELTPYGVEYRYPGDYPDITLNDAVKAITTAHHVRDEIRSRLPELCLLY
jgi:HEPN domain-containing protein